MSIDVELVALGSEGEMRCPKRFLLRDNGLLGTYVLLFLSGDRIAGWPADWVANGLKNSLSYATTVKQAQRVKRFWRTEAIVQIDLSGRLLLPLRVRRRMKLKSSVVVGRTGCCFEIRPASKYQRELDGALRIAAKCACEDAQRGRPTKTSVEELPRLVRVNPVDPAASVRRLKPVRLEQFVADCFGKMGYHRTQVGKTNGKDGGVDFIVQSSPRFPFPHALLVQVRGSRGGDKAISASDVRAFHDRAATLGVRGVFVTNSRFTDHAKWVASQAPQRIWLRDMEDLVAWSRDDFTARGYESELRRDMDLCKGVRYTLGGPLAARRWSSVVDDYLNRAKSLRQGILPE